jgi:acetolactate synthase I/II/III large subunit
MTVLERAASDTLMTASDAIVRVLEGEGVRYLFGIPGAHVLPLYDAVGRSGRLEAVLTRHEGGAAYMARMYARATTFPGVCIGTAGPGAGNLVTGVADAFAENVPMIVLTGQVAGPIFGRHAAQEATGEYGIPDQVSMYKSITRHSVCVHRPDQVVARLREAFRIALTPPYGPVHVSIPVDIQAADVKFEEIPPAGYRIVHSRCLDPDAVSRIAGRLMRSKRPAIIVGKRAVLPWAGHEIQKLMDAMGIPVATTAVAKGMVDESHPMALGTLHLFGHRLPDRYLYESDCIIAVGEGFDEYSSNYFEEELLPKQHLIQIDSNPTEIGRIYQVADATTGNIPRILQGLLQELEKRSWQCPTALKQVVSALKKKSNYFSEPEMDSNAVPIKPQRFYRDLAEAAGEDVVIQADMGQNFFWGLRYFKASPRRYFAGWGWMPMGSGVAGAIGLSYGLPGKRICCVCGDGAMQMNGMEVAVAAENNLPVTWVVFNDQRLNMVHMAQGMSYGERYNATTMQNPDFSQWARSFGLREYRIEKPEETVQVLKEAFSGDGPSLVDLVIDGDEILPIKPRAILLAQKTGLKIADSRVAAKAFRKVLDER